MPDLRVMVVADDPLSRAGLASLLGSRSGVVVTGQVAGTDGLVQALEAFRPDVVLWDLGWNPAPDLQRLGDLRDASRPSLPLAVLLPDAGQAPAVWLLGARVLLLRDATIDRLVSALAAALQGLAVLDPALAGALVAPRVEARDAAPDRPGAAPVEGLTAREIDVLRLLAEGLPNKAIARRLGISEHTVKFHVNAILGKLGVESRTEAVVRATRLGLVLL